MRYEIAAIILSLGLSSASPLPHRAHEHQIREVPQEHSHNLFLDLVRTSLLLDNPLEIEDPVFGLLGNAAAAGGAGSVTDLDCLQQATADQAFTNAKKAGDLAGMAGALVYRALERNTGSVGLASALCTETAANSEIGALSQHQDPASDNAASINKGIAIALAQQLAGIGADPLLALESGTFAAGETSDLTGKGNTCNTANDEPGCILSEKLLVLDATEDEISSAVAGIKPTFTGTGGISATDIAFAGISVAPATSAASATAAAADEATECAADEPTAAPVSSCSVITTTVAAKAASSMLATLTSSAVVETSTASGTNVQTFTGTLGGAPPPVISGSGQRPFSVGTNTFVNAAAALQRSCAIQHNACADAVNGGTLSGSVSACDAQETACNAASTSTSKSKRADLNLDFGTCGSPTILFEAGLDGRNTEAFIAADQTDYNHGSALNIAVIAGFICQRLGSPCRAPAAVQAACTSASAAAVATAQNQAAADVFNGILLGVGAGSGGNAATTTAAAGGGGVAKAQATATASAIVMTITSCARA